MWRRLFLLSWAGACAAPPESSSKTASITVIPSEGPMSGRTAVQVGLPDGLLGTDIVGVRLGMADGRGLAGLAVEQDGDTLRFVDQGSAEAGPSEVVLLTEDGDEHAFPNAFTHLPAADPVFHRMAALGASLTQGVQGGVPTERGMLNSPGAVLARQAGGFLPLPLLVPDLFPSIEATDIGPAPGCEVPGVTDFVTAAAVDVLGQLSNDDGVDLSLGRQDPTLPAWHVAVGGAKVADVVDGPDSGDFAGQFLSRLVYAPEVPLEGELGPGQLERVVAAAPTLVLSTDMAGNDVILPLTKPGPIDLSQLTPHAEVADHIEIAVETLASTGAEVFLATLPRPTLLPLAVDKKRRLIAEGEDAEAVQAVFDSVDALAEDNNAVLVAEAARYDNVHIVDLAAVTEAIDAEGVQVGDALLWPGKLGGLISTDGVHFSDVGYALTANAFIDEINAVMGVSVPQVELGDVAATDPYHPDALRLKGLDPTLCE